MRLPGRGRDSTGSRSRGGRTAVPSPLSAYAPGTGCSVLTWRVRYLPRAARGGEVPGPGHVAEGAGGTEKGSGQKCTGGPGLFAAGGGTDRGGAAMCA
eukprot:1609299-Rhodomonas_salina.1